MATITLILDSILTPYMTAVLATVFTAEADKVRASGGNEGMSGGLPHCLTSNLCLIFVCEFRNLYFAGTLHIQCILPNLCQKQTRTNAFPLLPSCLLHSGRALKMPPKPKESTESLKQKTLITTFFTKAPGVSQNITPFKTPTAKSAATVIEKDNSAFRAKYASQMSSSSSPFQPKTPDSRPLDGATLNSSALPPSSIVSSRLASSPPTSDPIDVDMIDSVEKETASIKSVGVDASLSFHTQCQLDAYSEVGRSERLLSKILTRNLPNVSLLIEERRLILPLQPEVRCVFVDS